MPAATVTVTSGIQWTPPSAPLNSGNASIQTQASYNGQSVGQIDVPSAQSINTVFVVPFASITVPKFICVKNMMSSDIGIRLSGASSNNFSLPPGGEFRVAGSAGPTTPITAISVVNTAAPTVAEQICFWVFGD